MSFSRRGHELAESCCVAKVMSGRVVVKYNNLPINLLYAAESV
jgi:hypothetical protein